MRITLIQDIIYWADIDANLKKTETQLLALAGKTDLVVLPEMFTTGFCTDQFVRVGHRARHRGCKCLAARLLGTHGPL